MIRVELCPFSYGFRILTVKICDSVLNFVELRPFSYGFKRVGLKNIIRVRLCPMSYGCTRVLTQVLRHIVNGVSSRSETILRWKSYLI